MQYAKQEHTLYKCLTEKRVLKTHSSFDCISIARSREDGRLYLKSTRPMERHDCLKDNAIDSCCACSMLCRWIVILCCLHIMMSCASSILCCWIVRLYCLHIMMSCACSILCRWIVILCCHHIMMSCDGSILCRWIVILCCLHIMMSWAFSISCHWV